MSHTLSVHSSCLSTPSSEDERRARVAWYNGECDKREREIATLHGMIVLVRVPLRQLVDGTPYHHLGTPQVRIDQFTNYTQTTMHQGGRYGKLFQIDDETHFS